jgi:hypothetical protein
LAAAWDLLQTATWLVESAIIDYFREMQHEVGYPNFFLLCEDSIAKAHRYSRMGGDRLPRALEAIRELRALLKQERAA